VRKAPDGYPTWKRPVPPGIPEAVGSAGAVAAPLLAGFSVTLIVLILELITNPPSISQAGKVIATPGPVRWPEVALSLLVAATVALLAAVQCAFWARQYQVLPDEMEQWRGGLEGDGAIEEGAWAEARREQFGFAALQAVWIRRFRWAYHSGILMVLAALIVLLVPGGNISAGRWLAIGIATIGGLGELTWIIATELAQKWGHDDPPNPSCTRRMIRRIVPPFERIEPADLAERKQASAAQAD
jgi:hypothetical protein